MHEREREREREGYMSKTLFLISVRKREKAYLIPNVFVCQKLFFLVSVRKREKAYLIPNLFVFILALL